MAKKEVVSENKMAKRKVKNGDTMTCKICGLSVVVEEVGDFAVVEETALICCGKPMKKKTSKAKSLKQ